MRFDVAVVGLGGMGSAVLAHCAARGASAIGIEQFAIAHDLGSSHGKSRMIRKAYFENPAYVPLILRAYELWRELERDAGEELLRITGVLAVGQESSTIVQRTQQTATLHGLPLEQLSKRAIESRYPTLRLLPGEVGVFEPDGGVLDPERAVAAHARMAEKRGAQLCCDVAMQSWQPTSEGFEIELGDGSRVEARALVLTIGPWFKAMLESLGVPIDVQRNVQVWFTPATEAYNAGRFTSFLLDRAGLPAPLYGFPDFGAGLKAAFHGHGDLTDAGRVEREVREARDIAPLSVALEQWMPEAAHRVRDAKT
ncbi:MAG TPA: N-methyl-L-tryptophan oxidase, partial [Chthoniobacterales bacterium]|nr:N-methyl-L-tryptophan oxidase [Chthoniobacterales bacterium]